MLRIAIILACVVMCYNIPVSGGEFTELEDLRKNSYYSLALGILVLSASRAWPAVAIAAIEATLIAVNLTMAANWFGNATILDVFYPQIQMGAYILELLLIAIGVALVGANNNHDNNSVLSGWFGRSNRVRRL